MDILQRERLLKFGAVPFTTDVIAGELGDYSAVLAKIAALVDEGSLVAAGGDFRRSCLRVGITRHEEI